MILKNINLIPGLRYFNNFVTPQQKQELLSMINSHKWCHRLLRRQQYYGIKYFQTKIQDSVLQPKNSNDYYPISHFESIIKRTIDPFKFFQANDPPNQVLVNRYTKGIRLGLHIEDTKAFGNVIVGVSLGSHQYLRLMEDANRNNQYYLSLEDRSCYVLTGQARFKWRHGIGRTLKNQQYKEEGFQRISLTIRHVIDSRRKIETNIAEKSEPMNRF